MRTVSKAFVAIFATALFMLAPSAARAVTITFNANGPLGEDADITIGGTVSNTAQLFTTNAPPVSSRRSFIKFDLSGLQGPSQWTLTSVTLRLYLESATSTATTNIVHRVTAAWSEASFPNGGYNTAVDNGAINLGSLGPANNTAGYKELTGANILAAVQLWQSGTTNNGFRIEIPGAAGNRVFTSSEGTSSQRPELVVEYTVVPEPSTFLLAGAGGLMMMMRRRRPRRPGSPEQVSSVN